MKRKFFMGELRAEFQDKDSVELFKMCVVEFLKIAGVLVLLFCAVWIVIKPDFGYSYGVFTVEDPISGFVYYIKGDEVAVKSLVHTGPVKDGYLKMPDSFMGRPVTEIAIHGWSSDWGVETIEIPDSVTLISSVSAWGVKEVVGGKNVQRISVRAFEDCGTLTKIELGDKVEEIGKYAFVGCANLKEIELGNAIYKVEEGTFSGCTSLEKVELGYGVEVIEENAFSGCSELIEVTHTGNLERIEKDAFKETPWAETDEGKVLIEAYQ